MGSPQYRFLQILEFLLFAIIIIFSIRPVENYDFWFHSKYGEYILTTRSLPFQDVFSHTAYGQAAVPYEWLFQVAIFLIYKFASTIGVQFLVVTLTISYLLVFRKILLEIFSVSVVPRMLLTSTLYVLGYNFWVERPQLAAYLLFMLTLYLVLKRVFMGKSRLFLTPFIFLIWTNLHASMILGLYLFFAFAFLLLIRSWYKKESDDSAKVKDLLLFGLINSLVTIFPPLYTKVYQLLYLFFLKRDFVAKAIDEWIPLTQLSIRYYIYLAIFFLVAVALIFAFIKNKSSRSYLFLFLPFIPLGLLVLTGVRHTPFTLPVTFLLSVPAIQILRPKTPAIARYIFALVVILLATWGMSAYRKVAVDIATDYPSLSSISFIKSHLKGNMFNEYHIGGYLMYNLGPKIKTFIDGRTDMFLPEVLPAYLSFSDLVYTDDDIYLKTFENLASKYHISWAILTSNRYTLSARLARILGNTEDWHLVFFDDTARIYVKEDGESKEAASQFGMKVVTPFSKKIYRSQLREAAWQEYEKMNERVKSAVATNALGFLLLEEAKYGQAEDYFRQALQIKPTAAAPKMNLAELSAKDGNYKEAIRLYRQAIKDDPERGLAYLRLGQLIIASGGSEREAREIWQKGLNATPDEEILEKLRQELSNLNK